MVRAKNLFEPLDEFEIAFKLIKIKREENSITRLEVSAFIGHLASWAVGHHCSYGWATWAGVFLLI